MGNGVSFGTENICRTAGLSLILNTNNKETEAYKKITLFPNMKIKIRIYERACNQQNSMSCPGQPR